MEKTKQRYQQALDYIYSFIDYSMTRNLRYSAEKFNLDRMRKFLQKIGNPQTDYEAIHVAGTKGKGSTSAMLTSILTNGGYRTGFYSSPHMINFNERIRIGNQMISKQSLVGSVEWIKPYVEQVPELTTFEIITAIAFKYFSDKKVHDALIEVGMGGRFDATNVIAPKLTVITPISHDHMKILGSTLIKIAEEKAGIIKKGVPLVIATQKENVRRVLQNTALEKGAPVFDAHEMISLTITRKTLDGQNFQVKKIAEEEFIDKKNIEEIYKKEFFIPLIGEHQLRNAETALVSILLLNNLGYEITINQIDQGFRATKWPGRFECISKTPLIFIDGAHNSESFRKFKKTLDEYFSSYKKVLIFGASEDKEVEFMLRIIGKTVNQVILTQTEHPRAMDVGELKRISTKLGMNGIFSKNVEDSMQIALKLSNTDTVILAAGSLFVAGAIKKIWMEQTGRRR